MASVKIFTFCAVFSVYLACVLGETCTDISSAYTSIYCIYGCCGHYPYQYCCPYGHIVNVPLIVGCTIGGIAFVCFLVAFICCARRRGYVRRGGVAAPPTVIQSSTNQAYTNFPLQPYPAYPVGAQVYPTSIPSYPTYPTGSQSFHPPEKKVPNQQFPSTTNGYTNGAFQPPPYSP